MLETAGYDRIPVETPKIGIFGVGLAAYWTQFPGLKARLTAYQEEIEQKLREFGSEVVSGGLVDTQPAAHEARALFSREDVDLVVCYVGTYSTSSQVVPAVQHLRCPILVLNLQPVPAIDYERTDTGEWLANCCACCVPEISCAFARCGIAFNVVSGLLHERDGEAGATAWREIHGWVKATTAARSLRRSRIGFLGHTYPGMLDMYSDFTAIHAQLGAHVEVLEIDDLGARVAAVTDAEIEAKQAEIRGMFDFADPSDDPIAGPIEPDQPAWSARVAVRLDRLVDDFALDALTYYYRGIDGNEAERLGAGVIVGNSLLTAR